jgi:hypothetical protein
LLLLLLLIPYTLTQFELDASAARKQAKDGTLTSGIFPSDLFTKGPIHKSTL